MDVVKVQRFDICLINLDPTVGSEIQKTRPCVVISPDSMNLSRLKTIIIAPLTSTIRDNFPTRILLEFQGKTGQIVFDQLRGIDRTRIVKVVGSISKTDLQNKILKLLQVIFS